MRALGILLLAACTASCALTRYEHMEPITFADTHAPAPPKFAQVGPTRVAYLDMGSGPVVLLLHGLGENLGYWSENVGALSEAGVRVLAVDLPGFGRSDKDKGEYTIAWQAAVMRGFMQAVAPGQSAIVVGHSMGGQIAMRMALAYPDVVRRLVLLAPAGIEKFTAGDAAFLRRYTSTQLIKAQSEPQIRTHFRRNVFHRWSDLAEKHLEERVRLRRTPEFERYAHAVVRSIYAMLDGPVWPELGALKQPVTVAFGDRDALIPNRLLHGGSSASMLDEARALMPHARTKLIAGAGHMLQIEAPLEVNGLILEAVRAP